jgi:V/A-type H+/Na+-transporting ATPase subunit I
MTLASIICVKRDVDVALEALSSFGEFHIEQSTGEERSLDEYHQNIQKAQDSLADAVNLSKQLVTQKTGLFSIFRATEQAKIAVTAENWQSLLDDTNEKIISLKKQTDQLNLELEESQERTAQLTHVRDILMRMELLKIDPAMLENLKWIYIVIASVPTKNFNVLETALATLPIYINHSALSKEAVFAVLATPKKNEADVNRILKTYHAEIFQVPEYLSQSIDQAIREVNNNLKDNQKQEKQTQDALKKLGDANKDNLASWAEIEENLLTLLNAETKILQSGRLATIQGFVPAKRLPELNQKILLTLEGKAIVLPDRPPEIEEPPTRILNNRFVKPFEEITKLYGLPKYSEVDPTPFLAISFPILFGLMFGDLGHGLILLIGGLTVGLLIKGNQGIKNVCFIMAACGIAGMVAGLLFGEFFGLPLPWGPLWFSPFEGGVFNFLIFALFVGIVQIISGLIIEGVNFAIQHKIADALLTSLPKILFYIGGVYIIAVYQLNFSAWLSGPILFVIIPFVILVVGKPVYLAISKPKIHATGEHSEMDTVSGRLFEGGDFFTRLLSNTISYSRILALLMAHWALLLAVYSIAGIIGTATVLTLILSVVVIVFGNVFVLALEGLIVFIHTLRLHFYEWFSKFYAGTGKEFHPYLQKFKYTKLSLKRKENLN